MVLSIITPCLNAVDTIDAAINSVLESASMEVEHIIIDGGSTDGTLDHIRRYPQVTLISEPDRGMYDALDKGVRLATFPLVGFLNADDMYLSGALETVLRHSGVREGDPPDAISGQAIVFRDDPARPLVRHRPLGAGGLDFEGLLVGVPIFNARFFRREILQRHGPLFSDRFGICGDRLFLLRAAMGGVRGVVLETPLYGYRAHAGSKTLSGRRDAMRQIHREHQEMARSLLQAGPLGQDRRRTLLTWHAGETARAIVRAAPTLKLALCRAAAGFSTDPFWPGRLIAAALQWRRVRRCSAA